MPEFTRETSMGPVTLCYSKRGKQGDPVFLIHGLGMGKEGWMLQFTPIAKAGFIVYNYDSRGFGKSTMTEFADEKKAIDFYSLDHDAEDLVALMDHLGVEKAHLVGTSMGGLITQQVCVQHPDRVISATIANSFSFPHGRILRSTLAWELAMEKMTFAEAFDMLLPWIVGEKMFESPVFETVYSQMKEMFVKANTNWCFKNKIRAIRAQEQDSLQERVKAIKNPVLLIGGSDDILTPPKYQEYTKSLIPHAELVILPNAGHASVLDTADAFNAAVIEFLKRHAMNKVD